jgi:hypothetical protein
MPPVIELTKGGRELIATWIDAKAELPLKCVVTPEDGAFVARCLDPDVASEGDSEADALANMQEALELYFEDTNAPV